MSPYASRRAKAARPQCANHKNLLPTPGATPGCASAPDGLSIKPTTAINPRPAGLGGGVYQQGIIYQQNGAAVTSNYGGGVKLDLPF